MPDSNDRNRQNLRWQPATLLALLIMAAVLLLMLVAELTGERIHANRQQQMLRQLAAMLPDGSFDNNPALATIAIDAPGQLQTRAPVIAFLATRKNLLTAVVFSLTTHDGYNGDIGLLVAIDHQNGRLLAVRTTRHQETAGIGDQIEIGNSDWLHQFRHAATDISTYEQEYGSAWDRQFDLISGATITTAAVVGAVRRISRYYQQHREQLGAELARLSRDEDN